MLLWLPRISLLSAVTSMLFFLLLLLPHLVSLLFILGVALRHSRGRSCGGAGDVVVATVEVEVVVELVMLLLLLWKWKLWWS